MNGSEAVFSSEDVTAIAEGYDAGGAPAPVVVGHPKHDDPAFGWVKGFSVSEGGTLKAELHELAPSFVDAVDEGRYRKISMSFFTPNHPANPKPGNYYPKHVGFLGGAAPAVSGLQPVQFTDDEGDDLIVEYSGHEEIARISSGLFRAFRDWLIEQAGMEKADTIIPSWRVSWLEELGQEKQSSDEAEETSFSTPKESATDDIGAPTPNSKNKGDDVMSNITDEKLKAREAALAAREAEARQKEAAFAVDGWIKEGKLTPAVKEQATLLLSFVSGVEDETLEFASGDKTSPSDLLSAIFDGLPKSIDFSESNAGDIENEASKAQGGLYQFTAGSDVDPESAALDARANEYMSKNPGVDYLTAVNAVHK